MELETKAGRRIFLFRARTTSHARGPRFKFWCVHQIIRKHQQQNHPFLALSSEAACFIA
jgi:hypothetical protein